LGWNAFFNLEVGESEKDDLRSLRESNFDKGIIARHRCDDGMNATHLADVLTVEIGKIIRFTGACANAHGFADKDARLFWLTPRERSFV
jgi:hypothetical protein